MTDDYRDCGASLAINQTAGQGERKTGSKRQKEGKEESRRQKEDEIL